MRDQVAIRGGQLKVKYLYEDSSNNRKINAITTASTQNGGTTGQTPIKTAPASTLSKEHSVERWDWEMQHKTVSLIRFVTYFSFCNDLIFQHWNQ